MLLTMRSGWPAIVLLLSACVEPALPPQDAGSGPPVAVCNPMTCTGCCLNGLCLGGNRDSACGYDGRRCVRCETGSVCESPGACFGVGDDGGAFNRPLNPDAGVLTDHTGMPLERPRPCFLIGWRVVCL